MRIFHTSSINTNRAYQALLEYKTSKLARISGSYVHEGIDIKEAWPWGQNPLGLLNLIVLKKL